MTVATLSFFMDKSILSLSNFVSIPSWSKQAVADRFWAASKHFGFTLLVAAFVTLPLIFWLYPSPFFEAAGGMHLLGLVVAVDVVLGPTLTFLIFDRKKASLKKDLVVIACLQLVALAYGLYVTALSRPLFMTYVVDRFETVSAAEFDEVEFLKASSHLKSPAWGVPQQAFAEQPADPKERELILFSSTQGIDLKQMFRYYKPLELGRPKIIERAKPITELKLYNSAALVDRTLVPFGKQSLAFVPLQGKKRDLTVLVNATTGELVQVVDLRPWADNK
jgi:hypothetical protein